MRITLLLLSVFTALMPALVEAQPGVTVEDYTRAESFLSGQTDSLVSGVMTSPAWLTSDGRAPSTMPTWQRHSQLQLIRLSVLSTYLLKRDFQMTVRQSRLATKSSSTPASLRHMPATRWRN